MRRFVFGLAAAAVCALAAETTAQNPPPGLPSPRVNNVFPVGAQAGTTVEVAVVGFDLDEPTGLLFSHPGIKGEFVEPKEPPPDPKKKAPPKKKADPLGKGPHQFQVAIAANVPPGTYDVRVVGKWGVSNPRAFVIGDRPEIKEKEPNNDVPEAQKIDIGTTVNGVISNPTDVDYTMFSGKQGQRVLISCLAAAIDSKARPLVEVYTATGHKIAMSRSYRDGDALADAVLPADGDYLIRLVEFTHQSGSADHVYRLTVGTAPWIDAVYPAAIEFGKPAQVTLYGRNLPNGQPSEFAIDGRVLEKAVVTVTPPKEAAAAQRLALRDRIDPRQSLQDGFEYRITGPGGTSNPVPIFFTREKAVVKKNTGGTTAETAEPIPAPCEVAGMLHRRGDRDWYSFEAKKGDVLLIELAGERIGSIADFYFTVHNPANKNQMMSPEQDDDNDSLHPFEFYTRTSDPQAFRFTAPADGKYLIGVGCRESTYLYGPPTAYCLRVAPPKPDFRVVIKPYSRSYQTGSAGRQESNEAYEVYVHRIDGCNAAITVTAEGLPAGVTAKPTVIGPAARWGMLVLNVGESAKEFTGAFAVKATAEVGSKRLVREARPASITWGSQPNQNIPLLARLTDSLVLAVRPEQGFFTLKIDPAAIVLKPAGGKETKATGPIVVKQGDKLTLPVKVTWVSSEKQNVTLAADPMLQNQNQNPIQVQPGQQPTKDKPEGVVNLDVRPNAVPGKYAIVIRGESPVPFVRDPMTKQKANLPAIAFADPVEIMVLPTSLAKVNAGGLPGNAVKVGKTAEMTIKVERQYDYAGEYKVTYVPPKGVAGVSAEEATIPAGKDEVKLVFEADEDAKPGAVNGGLIIVTALYDKKHTITHETKVNFNIAK